MFETDEAKLLEELRNYSQHKFLPYLNPAWQFSQTMPMAEFQFRLHVEPLLKWDNMNAMYVNTLKHRVLRLIYSPLLVANRVGARVLQVVLAQD